MFRFFQFFSFINKRCGNNNNNKDEDNCPKTLNDKNKQIHKPNSIVYCPLTRPNMLFQRQWKLCIPLAWASFGWQYGTGLKSQVQSQAEAPEEGDLWTAWQLFPLDDDQNMPFQRRRKWHIPLAICGKRLSGRRTNI